MRVVHGVHSRELRVDVLAKQMVLVRELPERPLRVPVRHPELGDAVLILALICLGGIAATLGQVGHMPRLTLPTRIDLVSHKPRLGKMWKHLTD